MTGADQTHIHRCASEGYPNHEASTRCLCICGEVFDGTGADQADAVEALAVCGDPTCRQVGHCCYPDYGLCGVRRTDRTDRAAAAAVPTPPHSPTSRGDQPAMTHHTTAQTDAVEIVSAWLDDDEGLRIPDTEWGRSLYDALRLLIGRQSDSKAKSNESSAEVARSVDEHLAEAMERIDAIKDEQRPWNDSWPQALNRARRAVRDYREEVRHG